MQPELLTRIPEYRHNRYPKNTFITEWDGAESRSFSSEELCDLVSLFAGWLSASGISAGHRVCVQSDNGRTDILAVEFAVMRLGAIVCPIHTHLPAESLQSIISLVDPEVIIVPDDDGLRIIESRLGEELSCRILTIARHPGANPSAPPAHVAKPQDVAVIIFTSGTTGNPKGVMLTHENLLTNVLGALSVLPISFRHTCISYLPISHVFERIVVYTYLTAGVTLHFVPPRQIWNVMPAIHPHYVTAVPRILERIYQGFLTAAERRDFFRSQLIHWALRQRHSRNVVARIIARRIVGRRLKRMFGSRLKGIVVGGAAMDPEIIHLFALAGIGVREGYGLSESGGVVSVNRFESGGSLVGTVGIPLPGIEVRIEHRDTSGSGDILVRSKGVMRGYFNNPAETENVISNDGWLRTGDVGCFVHDRFLTITSRAKEIFKNSYGEYVVPAKIETLLMRSPYIDRAVAIGFQKPFTAALIRPDFDFLELWCTQHDVHWTAPMYMVHNTRVLQHYQDIIDKVNLNLPKHEQVNRFRLIHEAWTVADGLLTPSLKPRRIQLERRFEKTIAEMYK